MSQSSPPRKTRKLLVASLGVGALTFAACAVFPGCNLMPPPPCTDRDDPRCQEDLSTPDLPGDARDLAEHD
jgi:hypothetical protein